MSKNKSSQAGFSIVEAALILVILGILGFVGWYVWHARQASDKSLAPTNSTTSNPQTSEKSSINKTPAATQNHLALGNGKVTFTLPQAWTYTKGTDQCRGNATADLTCVEGANIKPDKSLPTRYGNGTEFFTISVSVYDNLSKDNAKTWFETDSQEGTGVGDVKTSSDAINGYDTFYRLQQYDGDGTTIREMDYTYSVNGKAVLVHARTYEPGKMDDGTAVGDFRQFEPQIVAMARQLHTTVNQS